MPGCRIRPPAGGFGTRDRQDTPSDTDKPLTVTDFVCRGHRRGHTINDIGDRRGCA